MITFFLVAFAHFLMAAAPGPTFFYMLSVLAKHSFKEVSKIVLGIGFANAIYVLITVYGIAELTELHPALETALYLLSSLLIMFLGVVILKRANKDHTKDLHQEESSRLKQNKFILEGFILTLVNPKALILYPMLLPRLLNAESSELTKLLVSSWFIILTPVYILIITYMLSKFKNKIDQKYLVKLQRIFGMIMAGFGAAVLSAVIRKLMG